MSQKMYFTVNGKRVQQIFNDEGVGFSLPYLAQVLRDAPVREDYREYEYGDEVVIPVTALMRYIEGAEVEIEGKKDDPINLEGNRIAELFGGPFKKGE